jgi:hypothetical protein
MASMAEIVAAAEDRRTQIKALLECGFTRVQIGQQLHISHQRVGQILNPEPHRVRNRRRQRNLSPEQKKHKRANWRTWYAKNGRPDRQTNP